MDSARLASSGQKGFTLVELLVVVVIIGVLIAILIPTISRARDQAKTVQCQSNMRQMSQLIFDYANLNQGRCPGGADNAWNNTSPIILVNSQTGAVSGSGDAFVKVSNPLHGGSIDWTYILNNDLLARSGTNVANYGLDRGGSTDVVVNGKTLSCPNFVPAPNANPFAFNWDAAGGAGEGGVTATCGPYGLMVPPIVADGYDYLYLGAKISAFTPYQFMLMEDNHSSVDVFKVNTYQANPNGSIPTSYNSAYPAFYLGDNAAYPPYSAGSGVFPFRHPYFKKSNFVFFDGHIELLTPNDEINTARRMSIGG